MELFINGYKDESGNVFVKIESFVIVNVFKVAELNEACKLNVVLTDTKSEDQLIVIKLDELNYEFTMNIPDLVSYCKWPVLLNNNILICGLCSVARYLLKNSENELKQKLLGFREACLVACAESSVWTKFCELDIISTTEQLIKNNFSTEKSVILPNDIVRFEHHLSKPVKIHNFYKLARENCNDKSIKSGTSKDNLNVPHTFAEGPYITLADIILYTCFKIFFTIFLFESVKKDLPLIINWFNTIKETQILEPNFILPSATKFQDSKLIIGMPNIEKLSLYKSDPTRNLGVNHTKQYKIDDALKILENNKNKIINHIIPYGHEIPFDWNNVPIDINPNGGALPAKRADRKSEQLENLAKSVMKIAADKKLKIVDFCSGSGHLGLLLAYLLPKCQIILVENKEKSLARAEERILKLNLQNVIIVQANLDYFQGKFDIGVSLHACGVATDMVIKNCLESKAHFVSCPCCYGSVKACHQLSYPRSKLYKELFKNSIEGYFALAHAADQTHEENNAKTLQGYQCMDVIDTDRKLHAEENGYEVHLGKLYPTSCTNKNNLLVGIYNELLYKSN